ncbi:neuronal acetylcholine receptor subunit alpha-6-like [Ruditapes philippinarum]|uniref:neuronal acetylcholine receptor subunit alpha-6-like n=1 Tax=Ruditapes philippinarum TaxID=129788 RepID=UPI00295BABBD|nr:neuronal acetylcholine receptor subunit alpha-6-like [Ruditapes philippinarum]
MNDLVDQLFNESRYNKFLRPLYNQSQPIEINLTQFLLAIETFDIISGELDINEFFKITWTDELLTWDPYVHHGMERIPLPKGKFWKPEILLRSGAAADSSAITECKFSPAWISYQGSVLMTPACTFKVRCNIDTTFYPFDTHECSFYFIVSNHDSTELVLNSPTKLLDTRNLEENGEWEVENFAENIDEGKDEKIERLTIPMLRASFTLKRRPLSALINSMAPSLLLCILNIMTCWVRPDSGERLSVVVTLYLAFVVTTTSLMDTVPNNSLKMPVISFFILTINVINAVCVTWSIFVVHLAKVDIIRRKLPSILTKMVMKNKRISMSKIRNKIKPVIEMEQATKVQNITGKDVNEEKEEERGGNYDHEDGISGLELSSICMNMT